MASDIWLRTILIVRKETHCRHIGYSYRLTARVLLYAPSHRQDSTYHGLHYTSRGALAGTRNSSMGPPPWRIDPTTLAHSSQKHVTHGVIGCWIDPSWWTHWGNSCSSQCSTTGVIKAVSYSVCGMVHIKDPLLLIGKSSLCSGSGFPVSCYLSGPLPYVQCHITVNKMCCASFLSSFLPSFKNTFRLILVSMHITGKQ